MPFVARMPGRTPSVRASAAGWRPGNTRSDQGPTGRHRRGSEWASRARHALGDTDEALALTVDAAVLALAIGQYAKLEQPLAFTSALADLVRDARGE